jgi:hypothetical protein
MLKTGDGSKEGLEDTLLFIFPAHLQSFDKPVQDANQEIIHQPNCMDTIAGIHMPRLSHTQVHDSILE